MPNTAVQSATHAQDVFVETFVAVSRVCLQRADELLTLNANRVHELLADSSALMDGLGNLGRMGVEGGQREARAHVLAPVIERTLTYSRNFYEILAQTQTEIAEVMRTNLAGAELKGALPGPWQDLATLFVQSGARLAPVFGRSAASPPGPASAKR